MRYTRRQRGTQSATASRIGAVVLGAIAGLAMGVLLADRGMLAGLRRRTTTRSPSSGDRSNHPPPPGNPASKPAPSETHISGTVQDDEAILEARVLETFRNDPVLVDRPIDIGAIGTGIIELTGWVDAPSEIRLATTLTRGTIGVNTVVNRLVVRGGAAAQ